MITLHKKSPNGELSEAAKEENKRKLSSILMYREENAYTVVRQIEDINKLTRRLRSIENRLSRM